MPRLTLLIAITIAILAAARQEGPPSAVGSHKFVSLEGRFSVSLPAQPNGFGKLNIATPLGNTTGDLYQWQTREATFGVGYTDAAQTLDDPESAKQVFNSLRDELKKIAAANGGTAAEVKQISLDKHPGIEQRLDLFTGSIIQRTYLTSHRIYQVVAVVKNNQRIYEGVATGVLDTFKILTDAEVAAATSQEVSKAEPSPLPQTPVAPRAGSDAADEGLHGRVKSVLTESQDLSGTSSVQTRKRNSLDTYNEQGNLLRTELYDYKGNLSEVIVFGYIDGGRVSAFRSISHGYDPPPGVAIGPPPGGKDKKSDSRYQYRYDFKYDDKKRLIEKTYFQNNGDVWLRYVYKYTGNQREKLVYAADGSLNQRYLQILDEKGNEVEGTIFKTRDGSVDVKQSFAYEFDSHGNWIKRTSSEIVTKDGREERKPRRVYYRTITYY